MGLLGLIRKLQKSDKEARILVLGLDNAGKTTILKTLSDEDAEKITPTQGFNIKSLAHDGFKLNVWDIGGQKFIRSYWRNYFPNTDGVVFVVDSADQHRVQECQQELYNLLDEQLLQKVPFMIFANKQDLDFALSCEVLADKLKLKGIEDRSWNIQACSAKTKEGLQQGMEWLVKTISSKKS